MEQQEFLLKNAILTPEEELKVRAAYEAYAVLKDENATLKEENAALKEQLAWLKKQIYGQKSEKTEVVLEDAEQLSLFDQVG